MHTSKIVWNMVTIIYKQDDFERELLKWLNKPVSDKNLVGEHEKPKLIVCINCENYGLNSQIQVISQFGFKTLV